MPKIRVIDRNGVERSFDAVSGLSLMENLRNNRYDDVLAICGGILSCATCHVYLDEDWFETVGGPGEFEQELLDGAEARRKTSRLSCQIVVDESLDGLRVTIADLE